MPYIDHEGDTRELKAGDMIVGSGDQSKWRLQNRDLAARHVVFTVGDNGGALVRPFTPAALVTVNGKRIGSATPLAEGDVIGAGATEFVYVTDAEAPRAKRSSSVPVAYLVDEANAVAYTMQRTTLHIGRDAGSTIQVMDPEVSRYHADIRTEAGLHVLYSMGEIGTEVNGKPMTEARVLEEGDRIRIGELELRYTRTQPPSQIRLSSGGEEYDLDVSQQPTGKVGRYQPPIERLKKPKALRVVAVIVALMAVVTIWLVVSL